MKPLISIIVPVFNVEIYLNQCIESILKQTYELFELIIVNDGSYDGCSEICNDFANRDNRIVVIHKRNEGLSEARNSGLNIAKGDFILMVDGDDKIHHNTLKELVEIILVYKVELVQFRYRVVSNEEVIVDSDILGSIKEINNTKNIFDNFYELGGEGASVCTKLYAKELFDNLQFKKGIIHEDEFMATHMLPKVNKMVVYNRQLYYYVKRDNSIINSGFNTRKLDLIDVLEDRISVLKELGYSDLLSKENSRYFMALINLNYSARSANQRESSEYIFGKIKCFLKNTNSDINLDGKFGFLFVIMKINVKLIWGFYLYKYIKRLLKKH